MSTPNINISNQNIEGKCDLKCSYNFKYTESNLTAKNNGVVLNLTYDNSSVPPVLYNNQKYTVSNISITCPSIHIFNGSNAAAEFIIEHVPVQGGQNLSVAIPIISSSEYSAASNLLAHVIESVSTNAPSQGDSTNLNIDGFNLQNIVPKKSFYSYTDLQNSDLVVFGVLDAIPLSSSTLSTLSQIITPYNLDTPGNGLFFNSSGPNTISIGEGIYISCKPTGSSKEETTVTYSKNATTYNFSNIFENKTILIIFQVILGCLIFIIVFFILNYVFSLITGSPVKLPTFANFKSSSV
jgi:hypothetical protein